MKDIIWTIIVVWLIFKVIDLFKMATVKRSYVNHPQQEQPAEPECKKKGNTHVDSIKDAVRQHINKTGEYVDFEEIK